MQVHRQKKKKGKVPLLLFFSFLIDSIFYILIMPFIVSYRILQFLPLVEGIYMEKWISTITKTSDILYGKIYLNLINLLSKFNRVVQYYNNIKYASLYHTVQLVQVTLSW